MDLLIKKSTTSKLNSNREIETGLLKLSNYIVPSSLPKGIHTRNIEKVFWFLVADFLKKTHYLITQALFVSPSRSISVCVRVSF